MKPRLIAAACTVLPALLVTLSAPAVHAGDPAQSNQATAGSRGVRGQGGSAAEAVRAVWSGLGQTTNTCPDTFDYFPNGGPRIFACHVASSLPYERLVELAGMKVFLDGPHTAAGADLTAERSFGRYNPAFVRWAVDHLVPGADDAAFRVATQPLYDSFVKPLATAFWLTWRKAQAEPRCFEREVDQYTSFLAGKQVSEMPYERYFFFMNDKFCTNPAGGFAFFHGRGFDGGANGNVIKTTTAWWIRRSIDGTANEWARGLKKLLRTYDMGLLTGQTRKQGGEGKPGLRR